MLKFSLIDYTTVPAGTTTVIEEPVGWDNISMRLRRSKGWHGFMDYLDDSEADFGLQFDNAANYPLGNGYSILKNAYETDGVEGKVDFLIEFKYSDTAAYETLYSGRCNFGRSYKEICSDRCYVEVGVETTSCIMTFKNRYDQKVNLDSLETFDNPCVEDSGGAAAEFTAPNTIEILAELDGLVEGSTFTITGSVSNNGVFTVVSHVYDPLFITSTIIVEEVIVTEGPVIVGISGCITKLELAVYDGLNKEIILPSKTIRIITQWLTKDGIEYIGSITKREAFTPDWADIVSEIDNTLVGTGLFIEGTDGYTFDETNPPDPSIYYTGNTSGGVLRCVGGVKIELNFTYDTTTPFGVDVEEFRIYVVKDKVFRPPYTGQTAGPQQWYWDLNPDNATHSFSETIYTTISELETIWIFFTIQFPEAFENVTFRLAFSADSFFKITIDSECNSSPAKVYLINEVMSRITEAYTNDCLRVYSEYFGRVDAQPYPSDQDGCGGLECITSGLKIRAKDDLVPIGDTHITPKVTVSMKEVFDAMNAIHNIGLGVEDDPNRPGEELIRVEPVNYFYNDDVLMTCDHVMQVERELFPAELYSTAKFGFAKWETENANGLNDPFGKREYRTMLTTIKNMCDRICQFIASDYAIEVTRRKYGGTTTDWKYDNDIFIICLMHCWTPVADDEAIAFTGAGEIYLLDTHMASQFSIGDTITIFGTVSNDGAYTITSVTDQPSATFIEVAESTVGEVSHVGSICNLTHPLLIVETGNVASSNNILFPETSYNLRITPARNAMRHFKTILMSYRNYLEGILKFTNGDGNYLAQIELYNVNSCLDENNDCEESGSGSAAGSGSESGSGAGDQGESQLLPEDTDISLDDFSCPEKHYPLFRPERVKYEYPVTWAQYKDIAANPYGLIQFQCGDGEIEEGWIDDFQLKPTGPNGGLGMFTLKPRIQIA